MRADVRTPGREMPWCDVPRLIGQFRSPLSIGGRAKAGLTDRNQGTGRPKPPCPARHRSRRTTGYADAKKAAARLFGPPWFIRLSNPAVSVSTTLGVLTGGRRRSRVGAATDPFQTLRPVSGSTEARWQTGSGFEANRLGELLFAHLPNFGGYVLRPAASKQQETRLTPRFADSEP